MTREPYGPERLDELALRLLDVCAQLRGMARRSRAEQLEAVEMHDKKALEWIAKLEQWALKAANDLDLQVHRKGGQRKSQALRHFESQPNKPESPAG